MMPTALHRGCVACLARAAEQTGEDQTLVLLSLIADGGYTAAGMLLHLCDSHLAQLRDAQKAYEEGTD